jgi:putative endonuclease
MIVMAGLVPAISIRETLRMMLYYVYILASRPGGALYVGVTNDLLRRVAQHKQGLVPGHTKRYGINKLVYFEQYADVRDAIQREKNMKHWPHVYKTRLIAQSNPTWRDLYDEMI